MELIKIGRTFFTVESLNHYIHEALFDVDTMDIYSYVISPQLGPVPSVDFDKFREKKKAVINIIKIIYACRKFISNTNIGIASRLIGEFEIKKEDLYN